MARVRCRVMTFNVRYDTADDGENAWRHRREKVASVVRFHAPDVVGLQEPLEHQYSYLRERLPAYVWGGVGRNDGVSAGEHCPIGWRDGRISVGAGGTVWLSETPGEPGSSYPGAGKPRLVTWSRLTVDGRGVVVCNTHFDHVSERARVQSARQVRRLVDDLRGQDDAGHTSDGDGDSGHADVDATSDPAVARSDEGRPASVPVVVLGDFNCTPGSEPYRILTDADAAVDGSPLFDAQTVSEHPHHGPTKTFECFTGTPDRKIDHVFVTEDVAVRQHGVLADHWDGRPPSDHRPVVAELLL